MRQTRKCSLSPPHPGDLEGLPVDSDRGHGSRTFPSTAPGLFRLGSHLPPHKMPRKQRDTPLGASWAKKACCPGSLEGLGLGPAQASASPRGHGGHSGKERWASTASSLSVQGSVLGLILSPGIFGGTSRPGGWGVAFSVQDGVLLQRVLETRFALQCSVSLRGRRPLSVNLHRQCTEGSRGPLRAERSPRASSLQPGLQNVPRRV